MEIGFEWGTSRISIRTYIILNINDLDDCITSNVLKFADDTKQVRKVNTDGDKQHLQNDLDRLVKWSEKWQMLFNFGKCNCLHTGHGNLIVNYKMGDTVLGTTVNEKDLGVTISADMKVSEQCGIAASKGNQILGLIRRNITYKGKKLIIPLYKAIVRPHLEYCIKAWRPYRKKDIDTLERIHRRATKMSPELRDLSYEERLKECGLTTLETRRLRGDQIEVFKILNGYENINSAWKMLFENLLSVPSPDKRGGLGVGPATPPRKNSLATETETREKTAPAVGEKQYRQLDL